MERLGGKGVTTVLVGRELNAKTVSAIALYIVLRMARRGERVLDSRKLAKLLFFALYTRPGPDGKPVLYENPPQLSPEMEFRIYLYGPYIRVKELINRANGLLRTLIGREVKGLQEINGRVVVTAALASYIDDVIVTLRKIISHTLGENYVKLLDTWIVDELGKLSSRELASMALRALYLEADEPPVKKAMVFNMGLNDYIEMLKVLRSVREDLRKGRIQRDYELDEILVEEET